MTESPPDLVIRSSMDVGPAKVRARGTVGVRPIAGALLLTAAQVATLDTFFCDTLAFGSRTFSWKHPRTAAACDYRFVGTPKYTPRSPRQSGGSFWGVEFQLEIVPSADAIVIGGGGGDLPEGGGWFQPPWEQSSDTTEGFLITDWGGAGVFEDPSAPPDPLLWQIGSSDEDQGSAGGGDGGVGGALPDDSGSGGVTSVDPNQGNEHQGGGTGGVGGVITGGGAIGGA